MTTPPRRRVVILDPSPAPTGALRAAINIARAIGAEADVRLALAASARVDTVDLSMFDAVVRVPMRQIRRSPVDLALYGPALIATALRLRRMLRDGDVLVVNDFYLLHGWLLRRLGFRGRIVTWVRIDPLSFPQPLRRAWIAAMRTASDAVVAVSRFIADRLHAEGVESRTIYDPLDPALVSRGSPRGGRQRIVQVANFTRGKGQDDAIAAFAAIATRFPHAELVLHGGDMGLQRNRAYLAELKRQAANAGLGARVAFRGFAPDIGAVLADADVALVLSHRESFSLACLEASGCGLPVIATRCGGPEEIVADGETGLLCPVGDVPAIADAMARLLADPAGAAAMGARGAALVRSRFSPDIFAAALRPLLFPSTREVTGRTSPVQESRSLAAVATPEKRR